MNDVLDPVIHPASRLRIMATLYRADRASSISFQELATTLRMTSGNLAVHLGRLEHAQYVKIEKSIELRKPVTRIAITARGRRAFSNYLEVLQGLLRG